MSSERPSVVLTGGRGVVGSEILKVLAASWNVLAVSSSSFRAPRKYKESNCDEHVTWFSCDLSSPSERVVLLQKIATMRNLQGVVNCAGVNYQEQSLLASCDIEMSVFQVNFFAPVAICRAAIRPMLRSRGGSVVNISSNAVKLAPPGRLAYVASKAALQEATKVMSREFARAGISFNCVSPGPIEGKMLSESHSLGDIESLTQENDRKRLVTPAEVAYLTAFLLSPTARAITGETIHIDSGS